MTKLAGARRGRKTVKPMQLVVNGAKLHVQCDSGNMFRG